MLHRFIRAVTYSSPIILLLISTICFAKPLVSGNPGEVLADSNREYIVGNENILQIDVYYGKGEKLSQKVKVSSRGFISFPLLGEVEAKGLTVYQLEKKLTDALAKDYIINPQVSIFVEQYSTVSILGEVQKPGSYPIEGQMTVAQVIAVAGGFTKIASPNGTKIIRTLPDGTKKEMPAKMKDITNNRAEDIPLQTGDMVVVPESFF